MKRNILYSIICISVFLLFSCDEIDEKDRRKPAPIFAAQNVLIEDFTGQKCLNCPTTAEQIMNFQNIYGENIIAVSMYGGSMALKPGAKGSLTTEEGNKYNEDLGVKSWPSVRVNRSEAFSKIDDWKNRLLDELKKESSVHLSVLKEISGNELSAFLFINGLYNPDGTERLTVWITEDNIVGTQIMPDGSGKTDYVHRHVFRASMTNFYGDNIENDKTYKYTLPDEWNKDNIHVVAFITKGDNVLNVCED